MPYIFTELSPIEHLFFILDDCLSQILESAKGFEMKLGL